MDFFSFHFLLFFPVAVILYYLLPHRGRWLLILLASAAFYCAFSWKYLLLLIVAAGFNYAVALNVSTGRESRDRIVYLAGLAGNILLLCFFKYVNYLGIDLEALAASLHFHYPQAVVQVVFPLGLSYFVFTSIAYLADVRSGEIPAERHAGIFAAYMLFFPKIVQGPIERAGRVIPQFREEHPFLHENIRRGLVLMLWGFFKKLVIADNLGPFVDAIFSGQRHAGGPVTAAAVMVFGIQLYADFSGYTDIALGTAKLMGFDLAQNFRQPFRARSVRDFWTRWHMSLSSWCSDYVFLPVLSNSYRLKKFMKRYSFLKGISAEKITYTAGAYATFLIIGIWHGVGWNYLIVGLLFGSYVSLDILTHDLRKKMTGRTGLAGHPRLSLALNVLATMILVNFAWIFFRTATPAQAWLVISDLFTGWTAAGIGNDVSFIAVSGLNGRQLAAGAAGTVLLLATEMLPETKDLPGRILDAPVYLRWMIYYLLVAAIVLYCATQSRQFIYLQF